MDAECKRQYRHGHTAVDTAVPMAGRSDLAMHRTGPDADTLLAGSGHWRHRRNQCTVRHTQHTRRSGRRGRSRRENGIGRPAMITTSLVLLLVLIDRKSVV